MLIIPIQYLNLFLEITNNKKIPHTEDILIQKTFSTCADSNTNTMKSCLLTLFLTFFFLIFRNFCYFWHFLRLFLSTIKIILHVTSHMSLFTCHLSHVTCHMSTSTCHMSPSTCHLRQQIQTFPC